MAAGSDHAGYRLKRLLAERLAERGHQVVDLGAHSEDRVDYPDFGAAVGRAVGGGLADLGLCVCGSGIGIAMAANKVDGVRAATVHDANSAALARRHNDANVICFGQRLIDDSVALEALDAFLDATFEGGRHVARVAKLDALGEPPADPSSASGPATAVAAAPDASADPADPTAPNAARFAPLPAELRLLWSRFCDWDEEFFPNHVGMFVEDVRRDYTRLRLPWKASLRQPEGVMHGGVIAAVIDTSVVPSILAHYDTHPRMATVHLGVQYLRPVIESDVVAEGWVEHRGRSMVYCRAEVRSVGPSGHVELVATANLVFRVSLPSRRPAGVQ